MMRVKNFNYYFEFINLNVDYIKSSLFICINFFNSLLFSLFQILLFANTVAKEFSLRLRSHVFKCAALSCSVSWRGHLFSVNLYSVEFPESYSCNVATWQSLHRTCTIVHHSDTYPHPYECAFETH